MIHNKKCIYEIKKRNLHTNSNKHKPSFQSLTAWEYFFPTISVFVFLFTPFAENYKLLKLFFFLRNANVISKNISSLPARDEHPN